MEWWVQEGSRDTCLESRGYKEDPKGNLFPPPEQGDNLDLLPIPAAASAASQDYSRAVADYRNCLAANPSHVNTCDGLRHIMDADAQVLSGSASPQQNSAGTTQGR